MSGCFTPHVSPTLDIPGNWTLVWATLPAPLSLSKTLGARPGFALAVVSGGSA